MRRVLCALALATAFVTPALAGPLRGWVSSGDRKLSLTEQAPVAATAPDAVGELPVLTVDAGERHQTMVGFGAAITDSAAHILQSRLNPQQRHALLQELFGREGNGLGFSLTRLTIGASDFSLDHYSLDDAPGGADDPELKYFSVAKPAAEVFPTVREALAINPNLRTVASPWSAPAWMKTTGSLYRGQLKPAAYPIYARFFVRYIQAAAAQGVPTDYLTIQNEPDFEPYNYPGMRWNAPDRARFVGEHLGPLFEQQGIRTRILDWDHNWDQPEQPLTLFTDPKASRFVAGVAWHCYKGQVRAQEVVRAAFPDKEVLLSECSGGNWAPDYSDSFTWMVRDLIIGASRHGSQGSLMWNLVLDEKHGPFKGGCTDCRGIVTVNAKTGAITRNQEYYAFGHASRFVKPGAVRIGSPAELGDVDSVAFENPDGTRVLIALNHGKSPIRFAIADGDKRFVVSLPAKAAGTYVW